MRALRSLAGALAVAAALIATPVHADGLALTVVAGWDGYTNGSGFAPYTGKIEKRGASDFQGALQLRPLPSQGMPLSISLGATYQVSVTVPAGASRRVTLYATPSTSGQYEAVL